MKEGNFDGDFFHALVLFQVKAVAFVATAETEKERAHRAKAVTVALEMLSVPGFSEFKAKLAMAYGPCDDAGVLCHGVCMPPESCYMEYSSQRA